VDGAQTSWRSLVRADDLAQLTAQGVRALADYGVETVVDLRWPEEAALHPSPVPAALPQVRYERISLLTRTEDEWRLRSRDVAKELWKCVVLEHVRVELRHVLAAIAAAPAGPLLFHCVAGKDRTGLIAALLLAVADAEPQAIARDYAMSSANLRDAYLERYAAAPQYVADPGLRFDLREVLCGPETGVDFGPLGKRPVGVKKKSSPTEDRGPRGKSLVANRAIHTELCPYAGILSSLLRFQRQNQLPQWRAHSFCNSNTLS